MRRRRRSVSILHSGEIALNSAPRLGCKTCMGGGNAPVTYLLTPRICLLTGFVALKKLC